jgi:hypothetical protein
MGLWPCHGTAVDALRPAWASWMAGTAPASLMNFAIGLKASVCVSDQMPRSIGLMRPSGETALASAITAPAPPIARLPRCTRCQLPGTPSRVEYMHMGETMMRLRKVTPRIVRGVNRTDTGGIP